MMEVTGVMIAAALLGGALLGIGYFALLYRAVQLLAAAAPLGTIVPLHLLRAGLGAGAFWGLAQLGLWPLLAGLAGFLSVRLLAQRLVAGP